MNNKIQTAFTLIELLVVIAIVGILSGLIIVGMSNSVQSATLAKAQIFSSSLRDSLLSNLISDWRFNEGTGATTADSWSGGNACTFNDSGGACSTTLCPQWQSTNCIYGKCLSFNGSGAYLDCTNNSNLDFPTSNFTVEAWVNMNSFASSSVIFSKQLCLSGNPGWDIKIGTNGVSSFEINDGTYATFSFGNNLSTNTWYDLVFNVIRTGNITRYVNGVADGSVSISARSGSVGNTYSFKIGIYSCAPTYSGAFNGKIGGARVYNGSVPTSEVREHYYSGMNALLTTGEVNKKEYKFSLNKLLNNVAKN